ncbi:MAG: hypothetical protein SangKO_086750 [Sandaracinaceae bacterium]
MTFGSGGPGAPERSRGDSPSAGHAEGNRDTREHRCHAVEAARALVEAAASGEAITAAMIEALRAAVLERRDVRLALELGADGPHVVRRALELGQLLLEGEVTSEDANWGSR